MPVTPKPYPSHTRTPSFPRHSPYLPFYILTKTRALLVLLVGELAPAKLWLPSQPCLLPLWQNAADREGVNEEDCTANV